MLPTCAFDIQDNNTFVTTVRLNLFSSSPWQALTKNISHRVYTSHALIAQVSFQRDSAPHTTSSHKRSKDNHFLYSILHDIKRRAWWKRCLSHAGKKQSSGTRWGDQKMPTSIPIEHSF